MSILESNVFPITNLSDLAASYRLYRIRGLRPEHPQYFHNRQALISRLSYGLRSPVTIIDRDGTPHAVIRDDADEPSSTVKLVRATAILERVDGDFRLDFTTRAPQTDGICLRFLNFMLQPSLRRNTEFWQPGAGQPFYFKSPCRTQRGVCQYRGFAVRAVLTADGGLGICVDVKHAYASESPLPVRLSRREFRRWQVSRCIYHYGLDWYKIRLNDLSDLNASEETIERDGSSVSLLEWIGLECAEAACRRRSHACPRTPPSSITATIGGKPARRPAGALLSRVLDRRCLGRNRSQRQTILRRESDAAGSTTSCATICRTYASATSASASPEPRRRPPEDVQGS